MKPQARVDGISARRLLEGIMKEVRPDAGAER